VEDAEEVLSPLENHLIKKLQTLEKSQTSVLSFYGTEKFEARTLTYQHQRASINGNLFQTFPQLSEFFTINRST
jgi:hypothetical protein